MGTLGFEVELEALMGVYFGWFRYRRNCKRLLEF